MSELSIGDKIPEFRLPVSENEEISSSSLLGNMAVIYFYPKDNTPGCTTQACNFRDRLDELNKLDAKVIGISKDSLKKHQNFKAKHNLNFPLASDENDDVCERFGVWKEKSMYGKKFHGIERSTFLIGENGNILKIWRNVKVKDHIEEIYDVIKAHASAKSSHA